MPISDEHAEKAPPDPAPADPAPDDPDSSGSPPVGRLAPSPTGAQHLGNARTYLLAWLSIRSRGGRLLLRIEDIDSPRVKAGAVEQAIDDLRWLGLDWDAGPDRGGPEGPYVQTERSELYAAALERLVAAGRVYPCVCSRTDIAAAASAPHVGQEGPLYPGTCRGWQPGDRRPRADDFCWRFRAGEQPLGFDDLVAGPQRSIPAEELGDFPVTRKGGAAAYQLAVVVDDAAMGVTEVLRGDDLLPSAFRQLELYQALALTPPRFAHVPLVVGPDGRRLAKRHGDTRLSHLRSAGVRPQRIVGWAAWSAGLIPSWEEIEVGELLSAFDLRKLDRRPAVVTEPIERRLLGMG